MRDIFEGFFAGLDEVLRFRTTVMVIIFGAVSIGIWTVIGGLYWPQLIAFTNQLIDWLPFAMLRSNGAWMLSTFLWLQAIMLTVALLSLLLTVTVYRKLPKEKYTSAAVLTVVGSTALWSVVWLFKGKAIHAAVLHWLTTLPFDTVETGVSWLLAFYILYNAVIVTMLFFTSAYTPVLLRRVREAHYPYESVHIEAEMRSFGYTVRDTVLFAAGSLLLLPLLFIPVINVFTQMALWIWLVKDTFTYDVAALFYTKEEIERTKRRNGMLWTIAAVTAFFNFFPLINFAGPFVGEIMMFHYLVGLKSKQ